MGNWTEWLSYDPICNNYNCYAFSGNGEVHIDNIILASEPAMQTLLGASSLLLIWRKKS